MNSPTIFTSVFTRLPRAKKKLLESLLLRSGVVSLWELLVRKSVIKGKKFYSCGLFVFYHGTNFRILFPRHSKVNKDWMRVRRVVISSFPMFIIFLRDFYSIVRSGKFEDKTFLLYNSKANKNPDTNFQIADSILSTIQILFSFLEIFYLSPVICLEFFNLQAKFDYWVG